MRTVKFVVSDADVAAHAAGMTDSMVFRLEQALHYGVPPAPPSPPSVKKCCDNGVGCFDVGFDGTFFISWGDETVYDVTHCPWCGLKLEKA